MGTDIGAVSRRCRSNTHWKVLDFDRSLDYDANASNLTGLSTHPDEDDKNNSMHSE
jgi:hypothetical protein